MRTESAPGTGTNRFNRRHDKLFGHVFSGRYKPLICVEQLAGVFGGLVAVAGLAAGGCG